MAEKYIDEDKIVNLDRMAVYAFEMLDFRCKELIFKYLADDAQGKSKKRCSKFIISKCGIYLDSIGKSPIEQMMELALRIVSYEHQEKNIIPEFKFRYQEKIDLGDNFYIADFYFDSNDLILSFMKPKKTLKLVIECDGHEFHERTKEQVKKCNIRDYRLHMNGYEVLHFSGSQIYENPLKCAEDVWNYIQTKVEGWDYG